jgi:DNA replication protein DnaC
MQGKPHFASIIDSSGVGFSVDRKLIHTLAEMTFTDAAHNAVLVGGIGTGKTHLATAIGVAAITRPAGRCCSTC